MTKYFRVTRKFLETRHSSRNLIIGINTLAVPTHRCQTLRNFLIMCEGKTNGNGREYKKADDDA